MEEKLVLVQDKGLELERVQEWKLVQKLVHMKILPPDLDRLRRFAAAKQAAAYLVALHQNRQLLLALACLHDNIDPKGPLRAFSEGNPYTARLNRANALLWKARGEYESAGFLLSAITFEPFDENMEGPEL